MYEKDHLYLESGEELRCQLIIQKFATEIAQHSVRQTGLVP